jgi:hypothetical protein
MKVEVRRIAGDSPILDGILDESLQSLRRSELIWAGYADGELVVVWGLVPLSLLSDRAYLWSHTTKSVQSCKKTFVKLSRLAVAQALEAYPILFGICAGSTSWLRYLGAEITGSSFVIKA